MFRGTCHGAKHLMTIQCGFVMQWNQSSCDNLLWFCHAAVYLHLLHLLCDGGDHSGLAAVCGDESHDYLFIKHAPNVIICFLSQTCTFAVQWGTFLFFACCVIVETILVWLLFVETKAVPIEDCPFLFKRHWFWKR